MFVLQKSIEDVAHGDSPAPVGETSLVLAQKRETAPGDVTSDVGSRWQNREIGVDRKCRSTRVVTLPVVALHGIPKGTSGPTSNPMPLLEQESVFLGSKSLLQW